MATYASLSDLTEFLEISGTPNPYSEADTENLLERSERDVDRLLGPYPINTITGLKLTPESLTAVQRAALSGATCACAEFRLAVGEDELIGGDDYLPAELRPLRMAGRVAPKALEELTGCGLITWSGCASPSTA